MKMQQELVRKLAALGGGESVPEAGYWIGRTGRPGSGSSLELSSPIDGSSLGSLRECSTQEVDQAIEASRSAFLEWRSVPAPRRGEFVRQFGEKLRQHKESLAFLVTAECGKIYQEALGEVQEMIDICDFAVGLSRQLYGLSIASERPFHRLTEQWLPLGPVGCISAFNFPVAVWAWNAAIAWVCGDPVVWKPSEKTPLTAVACQMLVAEVMKDLDFVPDGVSCLVVGGKQSGQQIAASE